MLLSLLDGLSMIQSVMNDFSSQSCSCNSLTEVMSMIQSAMNDFSSQSCSCNSLTEVMSVIQSVMNDFSSRSCSCNSLPEVTALIMRYFTTLCLCHSFHYVERCCSLWHNIVIVKFVIIFFC